MERKYIFFILLFIIIYIISCVSPMGDISDIAKYQGTYRSGQPTLQKRSLTLFISNNGGLGIAYTDTNTTVGTVNNPFTVDATNIVGAGPYYSFQNNRAIGTLTFISTNKVYVTFEKLVPDYYRIGETLCTN